VDSLDLDNSDLEELRRVIMESEIDKIIVTMGSDKLAEFAEKTIISGKTIVFTGSALPYSSLHSDAGFILATQTLNPRNDLTKFSFRYGLVIFAPEQAKVLALTPSIVTFAIGI
jgi:hypothetical protein